MAVAAHLARKVPFQWLPLKHVGCLIWTRMCKVLHNIPVHQRLGSYPCGAYVVVLLGGVRGAWSEHQAVRINSIDHEILASNTWKSLLKNSTPSAQTLRWTHVILMWHCKFRVSYTWMTFKLIFICYLCSLFSKNKSVFVFRNLIVSNNITITNITILLL